MATPAIKPNLQKGANHRGLFSQVTCFGGIHQQIYGYVMGISWKFMEIYGISISVISPTI